MNVMEEAFKKISNKLEFDLDVDMEDRELQNEVEEQILSGNAEVLSSNDNRSIFRHYISGETAEEIIELIEKSKSVSVINCNVFRDNLLQICVAAAERWESPVEMLVYATKTTNLNSIMEQEILNVLMELQNYDKNFKPAYKNILRNWSWNKQISLVIRSVEALGLTTMGEELFQIVEKNEALRVEAFRAIVNLGLQDYFGRIVSIFMAIKNDTNDLVSQVRDIFYSMAKNEKGRKVLFNAYFEQDNFMLRNVIISAINYRMTGKELEQVSAYVNGTDGKKKTKAIYLLGKNRNQEASEIIKNIRGNSDKDIKEKIISLGMKKDPTSINMLKDYIEGKKYSDEIRSIAMISLGNLNDSSHGSYVEDKLKKCEDKNKLMEIACASVLVQLGDKNKMRNLFKYFLSEKEEEEVIEFAKRQLSRLKGNTRLKEVNDYIDRLSLKAMEKIGDKNEKVLLNILFVLKNRPSEQIQGVMVEKLNESKFTSVKTFVMNEITKGYGTFDGKIQDNIREALVVLNNSGNLEVSREAMKALKVINRRSDLTPEVGNR